MGQIASCVRAALQNRRRAQAAAQWAALDATVHKNVAEVATRITRHEEAIAACNQRKADTYNQVRTEGRIGLTPQEKFIVSAIRQDIDSHRAAISRAEREVQSWVTYRANLKAARDTDDGALHSKKLAEMTQQMKDMTADPRKAMSKLRERAKTDAKTKATVEQMHEEKATLDELAAEEGVQEGVLVLPAPPSSASAPDQEATEEEARRNDEVQAMFEAIDLEFQMHALPAPPVASPSASSSERKKKSSSTRKHRGDRLEYQPLEQERP